MYDAVGLFSHQAGCTLIILELRCQRGRSLRVLGWPGLQSRVRTTRTYETVAKKKEIFKEKENTAFMIKRRGKGKKIHTWLVHL